MPSAQESYLAIAAAEGLLYILCRHNPSIVAKGIRFYLLSALGIFAVLFPLSFHPGPLYFLAYVVASYLTFAAEMTVLFVIFCELRGRDTALSSFRVWSAICLAVCVMTAGISCLQTPFAHSSLAKFYMGSMQLIVHIRTVAIYTLVLYSVLTAQWWSRATSLTWCGLTVYSMADSLTQRIEIITVYRFHAVLQLAPIAAGVLMFCLWAIAMVPLKQQAITAHDREMIARLRNLTSQRMAKEESV
jgi:hypothetical protein